MNILMMTNTYAPHVGGVARSVEAFAAEYRRMGHRVLVVAPRFDGAPDREEGILRIPAIQNFNGSDFSVRLPIPGLLRATLEEFRPEIVHSHHPFLIGDTAVRVAAAWNVPLVFTHHTMWEQYAHYIPGDSATVRRFVARLATGYANLCDWVFAPSHSVATILRQRGVVTPVEVLPTGVDLQRFRQGRRDEFRRQMELPPGALVIGHVGRLAPEKNLGMLADAVARCLARRSDGHFLVVGTGPSEEEIREPFRRRRLEDRLRMAGPLRGDALADAYHAMDLFAFASLTETQGLVLAEAMAAGLPVVALNAPGVRDVVVDGRNGRLVRRHSVRALARALASTAEAPLATRRALGDTARATAQWFSLPRAADAAVRAYRTLLRSVPRSKQTEHSLWESATRWLDREGKLLGNMAWSAGGALPGRETWKKAGLGQLWRRMRRWFARNRRDWGPRLLGLPVSEHTAAEPGLILIQIDGLSRSEFDRALARRRLPLLRRLIAREGYQVLPMYSGLPASTPGVQGELFYGVKTSVPAFGFRDGSTGRLARMYEAGAASAVETRLAAAGRPLLEGGSVYSGVYTGGAAEAHFCSSAMGWGELLHNVRPWVALVFVVWHFVSLLRIGGLMALEAVLATVDFFRGVIAGREFYRELKYVPSRVAVSILLRELITIGATMDAQRGLPIIHVNFLGYDEQAHRRGPGSAFAHWSLKGIDHAIARIWRAARRSRRRDYQVWVYADHGQEAAVPYVDVTGRTIEQAISQSLDRPVVEVEVSDTIAADGIQRKRSVWLGDVFGKHVMPGIGLSGPVQAAGELLLADVGPVAHVYTAQSPMPAQRPALARRIVAEARVPVVLTFDEKGILLAQTDRGEFRLPEQAADLLGEDHPFLKDVAEDLVRLCRHPEAGEFVLLGWNRWGKTISFPREHGAHGGPGRHETGAWAMLPPGVSLPVTDRTYLRPLDLRAAALHWLGRERLPEGRRISRPRARPGAVRIMTYNVHSCVGLDGRLSPLRIARLVAQYAPDIVALQELDVRRLRTGEVDQVHLIAQELDMDFHFHPSVRIEEEGYGNAVLSPHPVKLIRADRLPGLADYPFLEPRGALWVEIDVRGCRIQLLNTHLGLLRRERLVQLDTLLGPAWLGDPRCRAPLVVCGDLNAMPSSSVYRRLASRLRDVQTAVTTHRPRRTWFSPYPLTRIDHMFVDGSVEVVGVEVPRTDLAVRASDHLPLVVDLRIGRRGQKE